MDIRTGQFSNRILPRLPDTQAQTLNAGQRLNAFSGLFNSPGKKALQQLISQILNQLHNKFPSPIQPGPIQPVYGAVIDPGTIQPVYGAVIEDPRNQPQPVYGAVIEDPGMIQPVYGAVVEG